MPAAFEDSLSLSDRRQDSYWSIVSELLSLIERTRKHRQASDLAKQIEGATDTASASSTTGLSQKFPQTAPGAIAISVFARRYFFGSRRADA